MIRLPYTGTYSLELVTAQNGANAVVSYSDETATAYSGGIQPTNITSATTTTICSTPASGTVRDVDQVNIKNTFAGSHAIIIRINANAVIYPLLTATLLQDESLNYTHGSGWQCKDANGNTKTSPLSAMTSTQLAAILTDETGTGLSVFNTSPTFATSVIGSVSMDVFNTVSTTVNAFGAATTLNIGAATGTLTLNNAAIKLSSGTVAAPNLFWSTDTGTGLYRIGANNIGFAVSGSKVLDIASIGLSVTGAIGATAPEATLTLTSTNANAKQYILYSGGNAGLTAGAFSIYDASTGYTPFRALAGTSGNAIRIQVEADGSVSILTSIAMYGVIAMIAGVVSAPSFYFGPDPQTGFYRIGANNIGFAASGSKVLDIASTGLGITGRADINGTAASTTAGHLNLGSTTQSTIGANGAASALTANPLGYLIAYIGTTKVIFPYYNA